MPTENITDTEINPSDSVGYGGGKRDLALTEINPTFFGGGGGGWRVFTDTEINPLFRLPVDTQALGKSKGFDFRGKGLRK